MPDAEDCRRRLTTRRGTDQPPFGRPSMSTPTLVSIGVGIDTARYGHHVFFLGADRKPAAKSFTFAESPAGYAQFRQAIDQLSKKHGHAHFMVRIDAAGQYAANLEQFLRSLPIE